MSDSPPPPAWIDASAAVALVAFGKATPRAEWRDLPEMQETRDWRAPRDLLPLALAARASGEKWRLPPGDDGYWSVKEVDQEVDRLVCQTGLGAAALAAELAADTARLGDGAGVIGRAEVRLEAAEAALRAAAEAGRVRAQGRSPNRPNAPRTAIPPEWFDEKRRIDPFGKLRGPDGETAWIDMRFDAAAVREVSLAAGLPTHGHEEEAGQAARPPPPVAEAALRDWYARRARDWPADAKTPSAERDLEDARAEPAFEGRAVTRARIRALRRELAPESWTEAGRRTLGNRAEKSRQEIARKK